LEARLTILLIAGIAIVAALAGCGGGDDSGGTESVTTSSLSKAQFIKKASAACRQERRGLVAEASAYLGKHSSDGPRPVVIADMGKAVMAPTVEAEVAAVRKLGAPAGDEEEVEAMLAADEKGIEEVKDLKEAKSIYQVVRHFYAASELFKAYGFSACTN
jgi:ethanolamine utilization protein EutP (predicted NTPase)